MGKGMGINVLKAWEAFVTLISVSIFIIQLLLVLLNDQDVVNIMYLFLVVQ